MRSRDKQMLADAVDNGYWSRNRIAAVSPVASEVWGWFGNWKRCHDAYLGWLLHELPRRLHKELGLNRKGYESLFGQARKVNKSGETCGR